MNRQLQVVSELRAMRTDLLARVHRNDLPPAMWHPYGFARFELGPLSIPGTQTYLHVWPRGYRGGTVGVPPLHRHSFDIVSLVNGHYRDWVYRLVRQGSFEDLGLVARGNGQRGEQILEQEREGVRFPATIAGKLHNFSAKGIADDTWAIARVVSTRGRDFQTGDVHAVPVGTYHATFIPLRTLCVTICAIRSRTGEIDALIGSPTFEKSPTARRPLTDVENEMVVGQVGEALSAPVLGEALPELSLL